MATRDLLDPRWHWIKQAADRLYASLDPSDQIGGLTMIVMTEDGALLALLQNEPGAQVVRQMITDIDTVARHGTDILDNASVSLAVE